MTTVTHICIRCKRHPAAWPMSGKCQSCLDELRAKRREREANLYKSGILNRPSKAAIRRGMEFLKP